MKAGLVINPAAGRGLHDVRAAMAAALAKGFGETAIRETRGEGDACVLARELALEGFDLVIAAGGDGTAGEVADGLLQAKAESGRTAQFGIVPMGTGTDFARGLGLSGGPAEAIGRIAAAVPRPLDAGRVSFIDAHGRLAMRHFVNIASLGLSAEAARAVNANGLKGRVPARALFFWTGVSQFLRHRFRRVRIAVDDAEPFEARIALVAVANGRFFGGGMMIAPDARTDDGLFEVVVLRAAGKLRLILDMRLVYDGRHRDHRAVTILRGRKVGVTPVGDPAVVEADGEAAGSLPATFEMLPGALMFRG